MSSYPLSQRAYLASYKPRYALEQILIRSVSPKYPILSLLGLWRISGLKGTGRILGEGGREFIVAVVEEKRISIF